MTQVEVKVMKKSLGGKSGNNAPSTGTVSHFLAWTRFTRPCRKR